MNRESNIQSPSPSAFKFQVRPLPGVPVAANCYSLFLRELRARGIDPQRRLALLGIPQTEQDDPALSISTAQLISLLRLVEELSGDPDVGLCAGERVRAEDVDLIGLLFHGSHKSRSAHEGFTQLRGAIQRSLNLEVALSGERIVVQRSTPGVPPSRTLSDCVLARTITLLRHLIGPLEPLEVWLTYPQPASIRKHTRVLGARVHFGACADALLFSAEILKRSMPHRDSLTAEILTRYMRQLRKPRPVVAPDLVERTCQVVSAQLVHGLPTIHDVSTQLELDERTLRRHLRLLGTSFQKLLDEVRREQALHYLRNTSCSARELTRWLGFKSPAAFYRAFQRWTGCSLREYQAESTPPHDGTRGAAEDLTRRSGAG